MTIAEELGFLAALTAEAEARSAAASDAQLAEFNARLIDQLRALIERLTPKNTETETQNV